MKNLNVEHFLNIYSVRKEMQEQGITDPSKKIKEFTNEIEKYLNSRNGMGWRKKHQAELDSLIKNNILE